MWKRRVTGILFVASLIAVLTVIAAPPARADYPPEPTVAVNPDRVLHGDSFTVEGAGFNPVSKGHG